MQFIIPKIYVHFFIALITFGCNNGAGTSTATSTLAQNSSNTTKKTDSLAAPKSFSGKLDTLYVEVGDFDRLDEDAEFIFHFATDTITVHGWNNKGGKKPFNDTPDVKFLKYQQSNLFYGPETYFGNMGLRKIKDLKTQIRELKATQVMFVPKKDSNYHMFYNVVLLKQDLLVPTKRTISTTNFNTNPSPPKQYN